MMATTTTKSSSSSITSPSRSTSSETCAWESLLPRYYELELESSPSSFSSTFRTDSSSYSRFSNGRNELDNDYNDGAYERVLLDAEFKNWSEEEPQNEDKTLLEPLTESNKELLAMPLNTAVRRLAIFAGHLGGKEKEVYINTSRKNIIFCECPDRC